MEDSAEVNNGVSELESPSSSNHVGINCALCGCSTPAVRCDKCGSQIFCLSCDDMYHRHPKRRFHLRKAVDSIWGSHRSPRIRRHTDLPGDPSKIPIPPPRKKKRQKHTVPGLGWIKSDFEIPPFGHRNIWSDRQQSMKQQSSQLVANQEELSKGTNSLPTIDGVQPNYENTTQMQEGENGLNSQPNGLSRPRTTGQEMARDNERQVGEQEAEGTVPENGSLEWSRFQRGAVASPMPYHDGLAQDRSAVHPSQRHTPGIQHSLSAADLPSVVTSPHPGAQPYYPHPVMHPHVHSPYSQSMAHINCPQCISSSWSNLMGPHIPPYHQNWSSAHSTMARVPHAPTAEGHMKRSHSAMHDPMGYPGSYFPFTPGAYPVPSHPYYPHGHPAGEPLFMDSAHHAEATRMRISPSTSSSPHSRNIEQTDEREPSPAQVQSTVEESVSPQLEQSDEEQGEELSEASSEEDSSKIPEKPVEPWSCMHCTFINPPGSHICQVCCKTSYPSKKSTKRKKKKPVTAGSDSPSSPAKQNEDAQQMKETEEESMQVSLELEQVEELEKEEQSDLVKVPAESAPEVEKAEIIDDTAVSEKQPDAIVMEETETINAFKDVESSMQQSGSSEEKAVLSQLLTTETQTIVQTTSTDVQTQKLLCISVASSTDSLFPPLSHQEISIQTEIEAAIERRSIATDPMISSHSLESLMSGVSAPPYHNRRAGLGRSGSSFSTQSLSAYERGRSRSPGTAMSRSVSMHGDVLSSGRGSNFGSRDPLLHSWGRSFLTSDPMYYRPHGLSRFGRSASREDYFDGTWGSMDRLNRGQKKKDDDKWKLDSSQKSRLHRSLEELKQDKRPESPYMREIEFLQTVKDAERCGYSVDDLQVAYLNCGKDDPVFWLEDNWSTMIKNVISLAAKYGEDNEESDVGTISSSEAKEALRFHRGNLWDAVTECIEIRQRKILELTIRGNFTQKQIVEALTANDGNVELAYADLIRTTSKIFKRHILSPGLSEESEDVSVHRLATDGVPDQDILSDTALTADRKPRSFDYADESFLEVESKLEKKRSDFLTKLSAIRKAQSERRKAREEKELSREGEKISKEFYQDDSHINDEVEQFQQIKSVSNEVFHDSAKEMSGEILKAGVLKDVSSSDVKYEKSEIQPDSESKNLDTGISPFDAEKDDEVPEDFDSHWIDSQGEWIEEYSDEQWDEEGEGEWVTVETKYRKLKTDPDRESKKMEPFWEKEEIIDDVFEDDSEDVLLPMNEDIKETEKFDASEKDQWVKLEYDKQAEDEALEENKILEIVENKKFSGVRSTDEQDNIVKQDSLELDTNDNWIQKDTEEYAKTLSSQELPVVVDKEGLKIQSEWIKLDIETVATEETSLNLKTQSEKDSFEQDDQFTEKFDEDDQLPGKKSYEIPHDSLSEASYEEEWEKVESYDRLKAIPKDNVLASTDEEEQYMYKLESSEEEQEYSPSISSDDIKHDSEDYAEYMENTSEVVPKSEDFSDKVQDLEEPLCFPRRRQKVKPPTIEPVPPTRQKVKIPTESNNNAEADRGELEYDISEGEETEGYKPPIPVRRKSKTNGLTTDPFETELKLPSEEQGMLEMPLGTSSGVRPLLPVKAKEKFREVQQFNDSEPISEYLLTEGTKLIDQELKHVISNQSEVEAKHISTATKQGPFESVFTEINRQQADDYRETEFMGVASEDVSASRKWSSKDLEENENNINEKKLEALEFNYTKSDETESWLRKQEAFESEKAALGEEIQIEETTEILDEHDKPITNAFDVSEEKHVDSILDGRSDREMLDLIPMEAEMLDEDSISRLKELIVEKGIVPEPEETTLVDTYVNYLDSTEISGFQDYSSTTGTLPHYTFTEDEISSIIENIGQASIETSEPFKPKGAIVSATEGQEASVKFQDFESDQIQENVTSLLEKEEELPPLTEMEATSAAADYYFGRYNEITVIRKGKKKAPISKASQKVLPPATKEKSLLSNVPSATTEGSKSTQMEQTSLSLDSKIIVSESKEMKLEKCDQMSQSLTSDVRPLIATQKVKQEVASEVKSEVKSTETVSQQATPPAEYLSFAEDYFFGSYNEVTVPKKVKKKATTVLPKMKPSESSAIKTGELPDLSKSVVEKSKITEIKMPMGKRSHSEERVLSSAASDLIKLDTHAKQEDLNTSDKTVPLGFFENMMEGKSFQQMERLQEIQIDVKNREINYQSQQNQFYENELQSEALQMKPFVDNLEGIKGLDHKPKSVHFQEREAVIAPPPRKFKHLKSENGKPVKTPLPQSSVSPQEEIETSSLKTETFNIGSADSGGGRKSPELTYTAAEYLFGRYEEIVPQTKGKIQQHPLSKKKLPLGTKEFKIKPAFEQTTNFPSPIMQPLTDIKTESLLSSKTLDQSDSAISQQQMLEHKEDNIVTSALAEYFFMPYGEHVSTSLLNIQAVDAKDELDNNKPVGSSEYLCGSKSFNDSFMKDAHREEDTTLTPLESLDMVQDGYIKDESVISDVTADSNLVNTIEEKKIESEFLECSEPLTEHSDENAFVEEKIELVTAESYDMLQDSYIKDESVSDDATALDFAYMTVEEKMQSEGTIDFELVAESSTENTLVEEKMESNLQNSHMKDEHVMSDEMMDSYNLCVTLTKGDESKPLPSSESVAEYDTENAYVEENNELLSSESYDVLQDSDVNSENISNKMAIDITSCLSMEDEQLEYMNSSESLTEISASFDNLQDIDINFESISSCIEMDTGSLSSSTEDEELERSCSPESVIELGFESTHFKVESVREDSPDKVKHSRISRSQVLDFKSVVLEEKQLGTEHESQIHLQETQLETEDSPQLHLEKSKLGTDEPQYLKESQLEAEDEQQLYLEETQLENENDPNLHLEESLLETDESQLYLKESELEVEDEQQLHLEEMQLETDDKQQHLEESHFKTEYDQQLHLEKIYLGTEDESQVHLGERQLERDEPQHFRKSQLETEEQQSNLKEKQLKTENEQLHIEESDEIEFDVIGTPTLAEYFFMPYDQHSISLNSEQQKAEMKMETIPADDISPVGENEAAKQHRSSSLAESSEDVYQSVLEKVEQQRTSGYKGIEQETIFNNLNYEKELVQETNVIKIKPEGYSYDVSVEPELYTETKLTEEFISEDSYSSAISHFYEEWIEDAHPLRTVVILSQEESETTDEISGSDISSSGSSSDQKLTKEESSKSVTEGNYDSVEEDSEEQWSEPEFDMQFQEIDVSKGKLKPDYHQDTFEDQAVRKIAIDMEIKYSEEAEAKVHLFQKQKHDVQSLLCQDEDKYGIDESSRIAEIAIISPLSGFKNDQLEQQYGSSTVEKSCTGEFLQTDINYEENFQHETSKLRIISKNVFGIDQASQTECDFFEEEQFFDSFEEDSLEQWLEAKDNSDELKHLMRSEIGIQCHITNGLTENKVAHKTIQSKIMHDTNDTVDSGDIILYPKEKGKYPISDNEITQSISQRVTLDDKQISTKAKIGMLLEERDFKEQLETDTSAQILYQSSASLLETERSFGHGSKISEVEKSSKFETFVAKIDDVRYSEFSGDKNIDSFNKIQNWQDVTLSEKTVISENIEEPEKVEIIDIPLKLAVYQSEDKFHDNHDLHVESLETSTAEDISYESFEEESDSEIFSEPFSSAYALESRKRDGETLMLSAEYAEADSDTGFSSGSDAGRTYLELKDEAAYSERKILKAHKTEDATDQSLASVAAEGKCDMAHNIKMASQLPTSGTEKEENDPLTERTFELEAIPAVEVISVLSDSEGSAAEKVERCEYLEVNIERKSIITDEAVTQTTVKQGDKVSQTKIEQDDKVSQIKDQDVIHDITDYSITFPRPGECSSDDLHVTVSEGKICPKALVSQVIDKNESDEKEIVEVEAKVPLLVIERSQEISQTILSNAIEEVKGYETESKVRSITPTSIEQVATIKEIVQFIEIENQDKMSEPKLVPDPSLEKKTAFPTVEYFYGPLPKSVESEMNKCKLPSEQDKDFKELKGPVREKSKSEEIKAFSNESELNRTKKTKLTPPISTEDQATVHADDKAQEVNLQIAENVYNKDLDDLNHKAETSSITPVDSDESWAEVMSHLESSTIESDDQWTDADSYLQSIKDSDILDDNRTPSPDIESSECYTNGYSSIPSYDESDYWTDRGSESYSLEVETKECFTESDSLGDILQHSAQDHNGNIYNNIQLEVITNESDSLENTNDYDQFQYEDQTDYPDLLDDEESYELKECFEDLEDEYGLMPCTQVLDYEKSQNLGIFPSNEIFSSSETIYSVPETAICFDLKDSLEIEHMQLQQSEETEITKLGLPRSHSKSMESTETELVNSSPQLETVKETKESFDIREHDKDYDISSYLTITEESDRWTDLESEHSAEELEEDISPEQNEYEVQMDGGTVILDSPSLECICKNEQHSDSIDTITEQPNYLSPEERSNISHDEATLEGETRQLLQEVSLGTPLNILEEKELFYEGTDHLTHTSLALTSAEATSEVPEIVEIKDITQVSKTESIKTEVVVKKGESLNLPKVEEALIPSSIVQETSDERQQIKCIEYLGDEELDNEFTDLSSHHVTTEESDQWTDVECDHSIEELDEDIVVQDAHYTKLEYETEILYLATTDKQQQHAVEYASVSTVNESDFNSKVSTFEDESFITEHKEILPQSSLLEADIKISKKLISGKNDINEDVFGNEKVGSEHLEAGYIIETKETTEFGNEKVGSDHLEADYIKETEETTEMSKLILGHSDFKQICLEKTEIIPLEHKEAVEELTIIKIQSETNIPQGNLETKEATPYSISGSEEIFTSEDVPDVFMTTELVQELASSVSSDSQFVNKKQVIIPETNFKVTELRSALIGNIEPEINDEITPEVRHQEESESVLAEETDSEFVDLSLHLTVTEESDKWTDVESEHSYGELEEDSTSVPVAINKEQTEQETKALQIVLVSSLKPEDFEIFTTLTSNTDEGEMHSLGTDISKETDEIFRVESKEDSFLKSSVEGTEVSCKVISPEADKKVSRHIQQTVMDSFLNSVPDQSLASLKDTTASSENIDLVEECYFDFKTAELVKVSKENKQSVDVSVLYSDNLHASDKTILSSQPSVPKAELISESTNTTETSTLTKNSHELKHQSNALVTKETDSKFVDVSSHVAVTEESDIECDHSLGELKKDRSVVISKEEHIQETKALQFTELKSSTASTEVVKNTGEMYNLERKIPTNIDECIKAESKSDKFSLPQGKEIALCEVDKNITEPQQLVTDSFSHLVRDQIISPTENVNTTEASSEKSALTEEYYFDYKTAETVKILRENKECIDALLISDDSHHAAEKEIITSEQSTELMSVSIDNTEPNAVKDSIISEHQDKGQCILAEETDSEFIDMPSHHTVTGESDIWTDMESEHSLAELEDDFSIPVAFEKDHIQQSTKELSLTVTTSTNLEGTILTAKMVPDTEEICDIGSEICATIDEQVEVKSKDNKFPLLLKENIEVFSEVEEKNFSPIKHATTDSTEVHVSRHTVPEFNDQNVKVEAGEKAFEIKKSDSYFTRVEEEKIIPEIKEKDGITSLMAEDTDSEFLDMSSHLTVTEESDKWTDVESEHSLDELEEDHFPMPCALKEEHMKEDIKLFPLTTISTANVESSVLTAEVVSANDEICTIGNEISEQLDKQLEAKSENNEFDFSLRDKTEALSETEMKDSSSMKQIITVSELDDKNGKIKGDEKISEIKKSYSDYTMIEEETIIPEIRGKDNVTSLMTEDTDLEFLDMSSHHTVTEESDKWTDIESEHSLDELEEDHFPMPIALKEEHMKEDIKLFPLTTISTANVESSILTAEVASDKDEACTISSEIFEKVDEQAEVKSDDNEFQEIEALSKGQKTDSASMKQIIIDLSEVSITDKMYSELDAGELKIGPGEKTSEIKESCSDFSTAEVLLESKECMNTSKISVDDQYTFEKEGISTLKESVQVAEPILLIPPVSDDIKTNVIKEKIIPELQQKDISASLREEPSRIMDVSLHLVVTEETPKWADVEYKHSIDELQTGSVSISLKESEVQDSKEFQLTAVDVLKLESSIPMVKPITDTKEIGKCPLDTDICMKIDEHNEAELKKDDISEGGKKDFEPVKESVTESYLFSKTDQVISSLEDESVDLEEECSYFKTVEADSKEFSKQLPSIFDNDLKIMECSITEEDIPQSYALSDKEQKHPSDDFTTDSSLHHSSLAMSDAHLISEREIKVYESQPAELKEREYEFLQPFSTGIPKDNIHDESADHSANSVSWKTETESDSESWIDANVPEHSLVGDSSEFWEEINEPKISDVHNQALLDASEIKFIASTKQYDLEEKCKISPKIVERFPENQLETSSEIQSNTEPNEYTTIRREGEMFIEEDTGIKQAALERTIEYTDDIYSDDDLEIELAEEHILSYENWQEESFELQESGIGVNISETEAELLFSYGEKYDEDEDEDDEDIQRAIDLNIKAFEAENESQGDYIKYVTYDDSHVHTAEDSYEYFTDTRSQRQSTEAECELWSDVELPSLEEETYDQWEELSAHDHYPDDILEYYEDESDEIYLKDGVAIENVDEEYVTDIQQLKDIDVKLEEAIELPRVTECEMREMISLKSAEPLILTEAKRELLHQIQDIATTTVCEDDNDSYTVKRTLSKKNQLDEEKDDEGLGIRKQLDSALDQEELIISAGHGSISSKEIRHEEHKEIQVTTSDDEIKNISKNAVLMDSSVTHLGNVEASGDKKPLLQLSETPSEEEAIKFQDTKTVCKLSIETGRVIDTEEKICSPTLPPKRLAIKQTSEELYGKVDANEDFSKDVSKPVLPPKQSRSQLSFYEDEKTITDKDSESPALPPKRSRSQQSFHGEEETILGEGSESPVLPPKRSRSQQSFHGDEETISKGSKSSVLPPKRSISQQSFHEHTAVDEGSKSPVLPPKRSRSQQSFHGSEENLVSEISKGPALPPKRKGSRDSLDITDYLSEERTVLPTSSSEESQKFMQIIQDRTTQAISPSQEKCESSHLILSEEKEFRHHRSRSSSSEKTHTLLTLPDNRAQAISDTGRERECSTDRPPSLEQSIHLSSIKTDDCLKEYSFQSSSNQFSHKFEERESSDEENVHSMKLSKKRLSIEDRMLKLQSEGKCTTRDNAFIAAKLIEMQFEEKDALLASKQCSSVYNAVKFLTQLCELCNCRFPIHQMASMVQCAHRVCKECLKAHFTSLIRDRTVFTLLCPVCCKPDITDQNMQEYFNHLDIMLRSILEPRIHDLFQQKLRDEVLTKDPNFHWCSQCSSGFFASPRLKKLYCPDCQTITCASCHQTWELEHEGVHCERFQLWKDMHTPEPPPAGLVKGLADRGIDCTACGVHYGHASGGCMFYRCSHCNHEFCGFCTKPYKRGKECKESTSCSELGMHAHHPCNCLFYLRDKDPSDLQQLLEANNVPYLTIPPREQIVKRRCQVREQKHAHGGITEDRCGRDIEPGFAGLCRVHYVEYLAELIRKHNVDPMPAMEIYDIQFMLRKSRKPVPERMKDQKPEHYRSQLLETLMQELTPQKKKGS